MTLRETIDKTTNTKPYENLKELLGKDLGKMLYTVVDKARRADQELDILHELITKIYNDDSWREEVLEALDKIENIDNR